MGQLLSSLYITAWAENQQFSRFCCSCPFWSLAKEHKLFDCSFKLDIEYWVLSTHSVINLWDCHSMNMGGGKDKGYFYDDWKEKACKLHCLVAWCLLTSLFLLNSTNLDRSNFFLICLQFSCQIMIVNLFRSLETSSHHQGEIISSAKAGPSYLLWYMIVDGCDPTDSSVILALTKPL